MTTIIELIAENIDDRGARMERVAAWLYENIERNFTDAERDAITDYVLREELTDTHPDKMTRDEYPIMSTWQLELRRSNEVPYEAAESYGSDGRNHSEPRRRKRRRHENASVDRFARSRNIQRRRAYNAFVSGRDWYAHEGERKPIRFILRAVPIQPIQSA